MAKIAGIAVIAITTGLRLGCGGSGDRYSTENIQQSEQARKTEKNRGHLIKN